MQGATGLPSDSHVHSEWSWDALSGSMERSCARALELGLPSVAFTEHADMTPWTLQPGTRIPADWKALVEGDLLVPPPLDVDGYAECLQRCRDRFPDLRIYSGVELSEPHWHTQRTTALLRPGRFERVLASVHSARTESGNTFTEVSDRFRDQAPTQVVRDYLTETVRLLEQFDNFETLAHIDYPVRYWPRDAPPYDPYVFEEEYRHVLKLLAATGKALEINTRVPLHPAVLEWWHQQGGALITFASDAHEPESVARGFREAASVARAAGFRPTSDPLGLWGRD